MWRQVTYEATYRDEVGVLCVCVRRRCVYRQQLDMSDPEVAEAALKIQAAMKGFLFRQGQSLSEEDSVDRIQPVDEPDVPDTGDDEPQGGEASVHSGLSKTSAQLEPPGSQHSKASGQSKTSGRSGQHEDDQERHTSVLQDTAGEEQQEEKEEEPQ